jgi:hypothetical protein
MRFIKQFIVMHWPAILKYGVLFGFIGALLFWRLGSLLPGYSPQEQATYTQSGIGELLDNPLNAPFLLAVKALVLVDSGNLIVTRVVATMAALAMLGFFCWLVYRWHGARAAIIGTLLFGTSAWFLHVARLGAPEVMMFGVVALVACGFWLKESGSWQALIACLVLTAFLLYVPGMVWFILAGVVWQWKIIDHIFKNHLMAVSIGGAVLLALLAPLVWGIVKDQSLAMTWLGLPQSWPAPLDILMNVLKVPYHLVVSNTADPAHWLGTAPVLDIFSVAMFVIGGYLYLRNVKLLRTPLLISLLAIGIGLIAIGGPASFSFIIPLIYVVVATGASYLLGQWLAVFPRNPIARGLGYGLMGIIIALACSYHLRHYFVGWPGTSEANQIYSVQKP